MIEEGLLGLRSAPTRSVRDAVMLGTGLASGVKVYDSPVGDVAVVFSPRGVSSVRLASEVTEGIDARPPAAWGDRIERAIERGAPGDLPLDLPVTPFRRRILETTATIPKGEVRSYGWLARSVSNPGAARAVGSAMASNPVPLIIPCHRVVRSDGTIGSYSLGGPENKWQLLRLEGAEPDHLEELANRGIRFVGSRNTGIYCVPSCRHARRISDTHKVELTSADQAFDQGMRPCRVCRPAG